MQRLPIAFLTMLFAAGCSPQPLFLQPRPMRDWPATLQAAKEAARDGHYARADSSLAQFAAQHPTSYEAREAHYWRALFLVDPANTTASNAGAVRALNQYFADGSTAAAYDEATVLRRLVQESDSLSHSLEQARRLIAEAQEAVSAPSEATPQAPVAPAARVNRNLVEEVRRLRDELAKSNQELERVKRRLSEQRP